MANVTVLSSGMGIGFPAITLTALTKEDDSMRLTSEQASWFGKNTQIFLSIGFQILISSFSFNQFSLFNIRRYFDGHYS